MAAIHNLTSLCMRQFIRILCKPFRFNFYIYGFKVYWIWIEFWIWLQGKQQYANNAHCIVVPVFNNVDDSYHNIIDSACIKMSDKKSYDKAYMLLLVRLKQESSPVIMAHTLAITAYLIIWLLIWKLLASTSQTPSCMFFYLFISKH